MGKGNGRTFFRHGWFGWREDWDLDWVKRTGTGEGFAGGLGGVLVLWMLQKIRMLRIIQHLLGQDDLVFNVNAVRDWIEAVSAIKGVTWGQTRG